MIDIPVAYAFTAGMVATINPCGFAMLPAYMAYQMGLADDAKPALSRVAHGTFLGLMATVGFVVLFGSVGLVITAGGRALVGFFPYLGLGVGVVVTLLGLFLLVTRRHLGLTPLSRVQGPQTIRGARGFFLFGIAYGLCSLSCTLPIFLVVVGSALAAKGLLPGVVQFVSYGVGMGVVLIGVTLGVAFFKTAVNQASWALMPYVERIGALALVATGSYLVYYWTLGSGGKLLFA